MEVNPYKNNGLNILSSSGNKQSVVIRRAQMQLSAPIKDSVSFSSQSRQNNVVQEKPLGAKMSQFMGKVMDDMASLPKNIFRKSPSSLPAADSLKDLGSKDNIYTF